MNYKMEEDRQLLEKFWNGRCTQEELRKVKRLLDTETGRQLHYKLFKQREMSELNHPSEDDKSMQELTNVRWEDMQRHIANSRKISRLFLTRPVLNRISIAAVFVGVIIFSGKFLWNNDNDINLFDDKVQAIQYAELTNLTGIPELYQLSDGTKIWLAAGSSLTYPEPFDDQQRNVELSGEAFFDVARDEARPFAIRTGDMQTRVLGTSFKVMAFAGQEQEVSVVTGKVSVCSNEQELALLTRGLQMRHDPETGETTQTEFDPATLEEWKSGVLTFNKLPMGLVAEQLENRYGIEIEFADPTITSRRVRGKSYPQESIEDILNALGYIGDFQYKAVDEKHYIIY